MFCVTLHLFYWGSILCHVAKLLKIVNVIHLSHYIVRFSGLSILVFFIKSPSGRKLPYLRMAHIQFSPVIVFLLNRGVRPTRDFFTHMETSQWTVKSCKFWTLACHIYYDMGHLFITIVSEDPWHSHYWKLFGSGAVTTCFCTGCLKP